MTKIWQTTKVKNKNVIFVLTLIACAFDIINVTAAILSINSISNKFEVNSSLASWTLSSYADTFSGFIAFLGRVGDIVGPTRLLSTSSLIFAVTSLLCAVVNNIYALIVLRALQGVAAAGVVPSGYAVISHTFSGKHQHTALALLASVFSVSFGIGFIIGGAFEETHIGYKGTFFFSFGVVLLVGVISILFEQVEPSGNSIASLDFTGCILFVLGAVLLVVGLTEGGESWTSAAAICPLIMGIVLLIIFFLWNGVIAESEIIRKRFPIMKKTSLLIPKEVWATKNSVPILIALLINYIAVFGLLLVVGQYFQLIEENSPLITSLKMLPLVISMIFGTAFLSLRSRILNECQAFMLGFVLMTLGCGVFVALTSVDEPFWKIVLVSELLTHGGSTFFFVFSLTYLIGNAPPSVKGVISGVSQTFAQLGSALAFSIIASIMGNTRHESKGVLNKKIRNTTYFLVASVALGMILILLVVLRESFTNNQDEELSQEDCSIEAKLDQKSTS
ncbi:CIC11C00000004671 [Sungouiella intermedia]|uniref:CIC11C00000004671 n=1 Tax=Sungouiella intermedia TaxID=45354 RepID=A0A1L0GS71_9ASCO|nr:CIC11C00000004671 [[Candida] intermedia]